MTKSFRMIKLSSFAMIPNFLCKNSNSSGSPLGKSPVQQQKNYNNEFVLVCKD